MERTYFMSHNDQAMQAIQTLKKHIADISKVPLQNYEFAMDKFDRWRGRVAKDIKQFSPTEASKFEGVEFRQTQALNDFSYDETDLLVDIFQFYIGKLQVLIEELENHPDDILDPNALPSAGAWDFYFKVMHSEVCRVAKKKFTDGHYADSVETAFKEFNCQVQIYHKTMTGIELDGKDLMLQSFNDKGTIRLDDLSTKTGQSIQEGYRFIAAGAMSAIRNPKAHGVVNISPERALHFLYLASLLFQKFDERVSNT